MRKASLIAFIFVSFLVVTCHANQEEDTQQFTQANQLYKDGSFDRALELYQSISEKNNIIHYNIGNCLYKLKKYGKSLAAWRRAEHDWGWFNHAELTNNIKLIRKTMLNDAPQSGNIRSTVREITLSMASFIRRTPLLWFQILVLFIWIFLFIYLTYLHQRGKKLIIVSLFLLLGLAATLLGIKYSLTAQVRGIVATPSASVRSGPGDDYQLLLNLPEAKEVIIKKRSDNYFKISFHGNIIGWIKQEELEVV